MEFTKEQITETMCKHSERENGLHDLSGRMLESMILAECAASIFGDGRWEQWQQGHVP